MRAKEVEALVIFVAYYKCYCIHKIIFLIIRAIIDTSKTLPLLATTADIYYHVKTGM